MTKYEFYKLGMDGASLDFTVDADTKDELFKLIDMAGHYNGFRPLKVKNAFSRVWDVLKNGSNPIKIGREGSMVIHIRMDIFADNRAENLIKVIESFKTAKVDEISTKYPNMRFKNGHSSYTKKVKFNTFEELRKMDNNEVPSSLRLWWD